MYNNISKNVMKKDKKKGKRRPPTLNNYNKIMFNFIN